MSVPSNTSPSPSRPGQVYVMEEEQVEGGRGVNDYRGGCASLLGVLIIICGAIALGFEAFQISSGGLSVGNGIWSGVIFMLAGVVSIVGGCKKTMCSIIFTMVMNFIAAIFTLCLICLSAFMSTIRYCHRSISYHSDSHNCSVGFIGCIVAGVITLICNIILIVNTCKVTSRCCGGQGLGLGRRIRLRPDPNQPQIVDPTRDPNDDLSRLNSYIPMFFKYTDGVIHCTAEENCDHIPRR